MLSRTATALALVGGILFILLVIMSLVSIIGRKLGFGSIMGDVELMQVGTAVAAAAFFPYCTLVGDHLRVDIFTEKLSSATKGVMDAFCEGLLGAVVLLLAWRTTLSAIHLKETGDYTTLLAVPLWIPVALLVPSLLLTVACCAWRVRAALGWSRYLGRKEQMAVDHGVSK
ncbi:TRAP transporter small permease [Castellaniella sp.]|uniref:TRAP transporter small permease n=1 Tax=Castellaniella sp. TaxID=1955812 RepID=UPI002AFEDBE4|nr:TRAP transporter small permease subunit [Castellaniella sp.]